MIALAGPVHRPASVRGESTPQGSATLLSQERRFVAILSTLRDRDAFSEFYVRNEAIVAGFLMRRTRDPELAADLTGETFAAAIVGAGGFRDDGQSAAGWLLGIARNLVARHAERGVIDRRARQRLGVERVARSDASLERVEALIDASDPANPLLRALAALPLCQRPVRRSPSRNL